MVAIFVTATALTSGQYEDAVSLTWQFYRKVFSRKCGPSARAGDAILRATSKPRPVDFRQLRRARFAITRRRPYEWIYCGQAPQYAFARRQTGGSTPGALRHRPRKSRPLRCEFPAALECWVRRVFPK